MAFNYINSHGQRYSLHSRLTTLTSGELYWLYYFAKEEGDGVLDDVPSWYEVGEDPYGRPLLHLKGQRPRRISLASACHPDPLLKSKRFFQ
jgi:hypothetical protein